MFLYFWDHESAQTTHFRQIDDRTGSADSGEHPAQERGIS
jgi:hypothetical protein